MKKFMVVDVYGGSQLASFFGTYVDARNYKLGVECGLGGYAEIYERVEACDEDGEVVGDEYRFLES